MSLLFSSEPRVLQYNWFSCFEMLGLRRVNGCIHSLGVVCGQLDTEDQKFLFSTLSKRGDSELVSQVKPITLSMVLMFSLSLLSVENLEKFIENVRQYPCMYPDKILDALNKVMESSNPNHFDEINATALRSLQLNRLVPER